MTRTIIGALCWLLVLGAGGACRTTPNGPGPLADLSPSPRDAGAEPRSDRAAPSADVGHAEVLKGVVLAGARQGASVGFADLDGDGLEDKLVGAPYAGTPSGVGIVLVYRGTATGYETSPSMVLKGDDNLGFSMATLADVDGDGKAEVAVAALNGASLSGSVTVYAGGGSGKILTTVSGEHAMSKFGVALFSGDLNADGKADLVVGAPHHTKDPAQYQGGAIFVLLGPDFGTKLALYATATSSGLGWSGAAGDLNGDQVADLCVAATGKVLCYYGQAPFAPALDAPDLKVSSTAAGFGKALAIVDDLNGDGIGELVIGAPNASGNKGAAYIVVGGAGKRTVSADAPSPDLFARIDGSAIFDRFGAAIVPASAGAGQKPGFAVGAPLADVGPYSLGGRVYFFNGKDITSAVTLTTSTVFAATGRSHGYGMALVSTAKGRLLIGSPRADADTGGAYVVDLSTGQPVPGGSSGGEGGEDCHDHDCH